MESSQGDELEHEKVTRFACPPPNLSLEKGSCRSSLAARLSVWRLAG